MKYYTISALIFFSLAGCQKTTCEPQNPTSNCVCTEDYTPVCGCDNETYSNSCSAECAGITEYTNGECK